MFRKETKQRVKERGIALLFTLGIMAILLTMALAFALVSRISRKVAESAVDTVAAKLLAESALERVSGSIMLYNEDISEGRIYPGTNSFFFVSGSSDDGWDNRNVLFSHSSDGDTDWLYRMGTEYTFEDGNTSRDYMGWFGSDPAAFKSALPVTWKYIRVDDGTDERITGRFAYIVIDESGKLDPNSACASGVDEGSAGAEARPGVSPSEINLQAAGLSSSAARNLGYENSGGKRPDSAKWFSWKHIIGGGTAFSQADTDSYTGLLCPHSRDIEACWIDLDLDGLFDTGENFHRFNLGRTDWDSLSVSEITQSPELFDTSSASHNGQGIQWLKDFSAAGIFPSAAARAGQIAANLIDYCDSDSMASTDYPGTDPPTYCGLDRSAYINEVRVLISQSPVSKAGSGPYTYSWNDTSIDIRPEIVNIYETAAPNATLEIDYTISATVNESQAAPEELPPVSGTLSFAYAAPAPRAHDASASGQTVQIPAGSYAAAADMNTNFTVTGIALRAYLKDDGGNLLDYAGIDGGAGLDIDAGVADQYVNYEVDDPRQNHFAADWNRKEDTVDRGSIGAVNAGVCNPGAAGDADPGANPWVSTAYIRNGPMQSPWELGAVHRGAKWETVNLKARNGSATGGGDYVDGDADILDQVKMSPDIYGHGKVNLNSHITEVQKAIAANIYVGETYESPGGSSGAIITDSIADDIGSAVLALNGTNGGTAFKSRSCIADVSALSDNSPGGGVLAQDNDRKKEEIIGKIVNITTVRQNIFTVLILAQAITDVGGPDDGSADITITKDLDFSGDIADVTEDGFDIDGDDSDNDGDTTNDTLGSIESADTRLGRYDMYFDEISAEQKILAVLYRDAYTNEIKILHYEFLEN